MQIYYMQIMDSMNFFIYNVAGKPIGIFHVFHIFCATGTQESFPDFHIDFHVLFSFAYIFWGRKLQWQIELPFRILRMRWG